MMARPHKNSLPLSEGGEVSLLYEPGSLNLGYFSSYRVLCRMNLSLKRGGLLFVRIPVSIW